MSTDKLHLEGTIIQDYKDWLEEVKTLSSYVAKWATRIKHNEETSDPKLHRCLEFIVAEANHLRDVIPSMKEVIRPQSSLKDLLDILDVVRTSANVIHCCVTIFVSNSVGEPDSGVISDTGLMAKYDEILSALAQEAKPHFRALGEKYD